MAIKCVFFDFDGVLRSWDYEANTMEEEYGFPHGGMWEVAFTPENVVPAVRGEITDEQWRSNVAQLLTEKFPDSDVSGAMDAWQKHYGVLVPEVLEIITECKAKVPIAMLSNATSRLNYDLEKLGIADLFDFVFNVSEIGSIKPEPDIYNHVLQAAAVTPGEAFFTDDMPENVDAAVQLGWTGHLFENAAGLRTALVESGVL